MDSVFRDNNKVWLAIAAYVLAIYLTLPVMRPALGFLYAQMGRETLGTVINAVLSAAGLTVICFFMKKGISRTLLALGLLGVTAVIVWRLERPEERVHFLEYGLLGFMLLSATKGARRQFLLSFAFVVALGSLDEFIQLLLPNRVGDLRDVLMNAGGGILGIWLGKLWYTP